MLIKANSRLKRVGLTFVFISIPVWFLAAVVWNIEERGFVHKKFYTEFPPPKKGAYWEERKGGYALYNRDCVNNKIGSDITLRYI